MDLDLREKLVTGSFSIANFEELKTTISNITQRYAALVITEDNVKDAKKDRARLNAAAENINARRLELERQFMKPFLAGKAQCEELKRLVKDASNKIDIQIKEIEEQNKTVKRAEIEKIYNEECKNNDFNYINLDAMFNDSWLNSSYKLEKIRKDIKAAIQAYINDFIVINSTYSDSVLKAEIKTEYIALANNKEVGCLGKAISNVMVRNSTKKQIISNDKITSDPVKTYEIRYIITGSKQELESVSNFLKQHNITYKVENVL